MTKRFFEKIMNKRVVDTREYRYMIDEREGAIVRLRIEYLDTTRALDGWETVKSL